MWEKLGSDLSGPKEGEEGRPWLQVGSSGLGKELLKCLSPWGHLCGLPLRAGWQGCAD